jgi:hypothetical protein
MKTINSSQYLAALPNPKRSAPKSAGVAVRPFIVEVEWVDVELKIHTVAAAFLTKQNPYCRSHYGDDVGYYALAPSRTVDSLQKGEITPEEFEASMSKLRRLIELHGSMVGRRAAILELKMEKRLWTRVCLVTAAMRVSREAFIRTALDERIQSIRRFYEQQSTKLGGVA